MILSNIPTVLAHENDVNNQSERVEYSNGVELENISSDHLEELGLDGLNISSTALLKYQ